MTPDDATTLDRDDRSTYDLSTDAPDATAPRGDVATGADDADRAREEAVARRSMSPIPRKVVRFEGYAPGTIVISTAKKRLYLVLDDGVSALVYAVGVGREGFSWKGTETISAKRPWPDWTPPEEMRARDPKLPVHMDGGLANPLGARALYLGETLYRIHGTNQPSSIGKSVSSGCIRLANSDIIDLYERVAVGATVVVQ
ncbi:MAG: L,D-transpeptidase [Phyllobacteriaceae bacterium]|nr:L,D-transpeptidase [Phyllobacteriaceae bacterium]